MPASQAKAILKELTDEEVAFLEADWFYRARPEQLAPPGDWRIWLFLGGRGAGKTRSGAEWIADGVVNGTMRRIGLVGATFHDARAVMIEGESGLARVAGNAAVFEPSNRRVLWSNVGNTFEAMLAKVEAVSGRMDRLEDARWLMDQPLWNDGRPNPIYAAVHYVERAGESIRLRRVCCLQYLLPDRRFCKACPVEEPREQIRAEP